VPINDPRRALEALGVQATRVTVLKDVPSENASWLVERPGRRDEVLRRYAQATGEDLAYEHEVLRHLTAEGWVVPVPVSALARCDGFWYCLTMFVPGRPVIEESSAQQWRRGTDLARLHLALRGLGDHLGQRPGWLAQHQNVTVHSSLDWRACVRGLSQASPRLAEWAEAAAEHTRAALVAVGAEHLPVTVVHGDFAQWNVHYKNGQLAGVIDFGLTHLDSRPYELAIARTYRAPHVTEAYRSELASRRWPLTDLEEAAIVPVYHAFRLDQAAWQLSNSLRTGRYDLLAVERQLSRTTSPAP
jgi:homoserine kinase type II